LEYRNLGETGMRVSEISLGTWAFGSEWGKVSDEDSYTALYRAVDLGVNFLDTADVYGDSRSERLIGRLLKERPEDEIFVATKAGRRLDPHTAEGYSHEKPLSLRRAKSREPTSGGPGPPPAPLPADGGVSAG
jgi:aryl-alcohol dehydrogenase-like predicted oxidoreductase